MQCTERLIYWHFTKILESLLRRKRLRQSFNFQSKGNKMSNPFAERSLATSSPARDIVPVTPSDNAEFPTVAAALYIENGGVLVITTERGQNRTITVTDFAILPVGVKQVHATNTTATGIGS